MKLLNVNEKGLKTMFSKKAAIILPLLLFLITACTGTDPTGAAIGDITCVEGAVLINGTCVFLDDTSFPTGEETPTETPMEPTDELPTEEPEQPVEEPSEQDYEDADVVYEVIEGELVDIKPKVRDPDGDRLEYTYSTPFSTNGKWQTKDGDAGRHLATITVSDNEFSVTQDVLIIINPANKAPVVECEEEIFVKEGELVDLNCNIYDPEGDNVIVSYGGWMSKSTKQTTFDDEGVYTVLVKASDPERSTSKEIIITVSDENRAPEIDPLEDLTLMETEKVVIKPIVSDPDGDIVETTFSEPLDENGIWITEDGDSGSYDILITATDGTATSTTTFKLIVTDINTAPVMERIQDITVDEGDTVTISPKVEDPEGDEVTIKYTGWMTVEQKTTDYDDEGEYTVTVTASDGELETSQVVKITVQDKNRPPCFCLDPICSNC